MLEATSVVPDALRALLSRGRLTIADADREAARRSLLSFTKYTFRKYEPNWHHKVLADRLESWAFGHGPKRLMVFMPPRHGKSELVSRRLPPYIFGRRPDARIIATSYASTLADSMSRDVQRTMMTASYQRLFPKTRIPEPGLRNTLKGIARSDQFDVLEYVDDELVLAGGYRAAGTNGGITGLGADYVIIDDPVKNRADAQSETYQQSAIEWYQSTLYTRLEKDARVLLTMTRWHHNDLAGRLMQTQIDQIAQGSIDGDKWDVINLAAIREDDASPEDPRVEGEALWPDKYSLDTLKTIKLTVGSYDWAALFQQRPSPPTGAVFKKEWFRTYTMTERPMAGTEGMQTIAVLDDGRVLPVWKLRRFVSCDLAISLKTSADWTVFLVCGVSTTGDLVVLDIVRDRMEGPDQLPRLRALMIKHQASFAAIESVQYQAALVQQAKRERLPARAVTVDVDKLTRALPAATLAENGRIFIPENASWREAFVRELTQFPLGDKDDQVDTLSTAVAQMASVGAAATVSPVGLGRTYRSNWMR